VFCFEADSEGDIAAYLTSAGMADLAQFEVVEGIGTCRDVSRSKIGVDLPWRDGT
jgi:hypothetical protein